MGNMEQRTAVGEIVHEVKIVRQGHTTNAKLDIYALKMRCGAVLFIPFGEDPGRTDAPINCMLCIAEGL